MEIRRYAICGVVLAAILFGTYYLGYRSGANNTRIEYVTKKVEVVKYVDREKAKIYTAPNASTGVLIELFNSGKL